MCGNSHLPPAPESKDLIAIIHPAGFGATSPSISSSVPLSRTNSASSNISTLSSTSLVSTHPQPVGGRLRLSNSLPGSTISQFSHADRTLATIHEPFHVRIHQYGFPLDFDEANPVMHEFSMQSSQYVSTGLRLNLGIGGNGVIGRTVSIVDCEERLLGEGVIGRI